MQAAYFALLCLLLAGSAHGQTTSTGCKVVAGLRLVTKHGTCSGWAGADCTAHAKADVEVSRAARGILRGEFCKDQTVTVHARTIATALAAVYTSAFAKISCIGQGFGCGFGISQGDSFATAYSETIRKAVVAIKDSDNRLAALCVGEFQALSVTITKAVSSSLVKVCQTGTGSASVLQSNFVISITKAITDVFGKATARVCAGDKDTAKCRLDGRVTSTNRGFVIKSSPTSIRSITPGSTRIGAAGGVGSTPQLKSCGFPLLSCCFDDSVAECRPKGFYKGALAADNTLILYGPRGAQCVCY